MTFPSSCRKKEKKMYMFFTYDIYLFLRDNHGIVSNKYRYPAAISDTSPLLPVLSAPPLLLFDQAVPVSIQ